MKREQVVEILAPETAQQVKPATGPRVIIEGEKVYMRPSRSGRLIEMAPGGVQALLSRTGLGTRLAERLSPRTLKAVFQEGLRPDNLALVVANDKVTDLVATTNYHPIAAERVLDAVEKTMPEVDYRRALILPVHQVQLEIIGVEEKAVAKGDLVRAGVLVRFSPLGLGQPLVQSYCQRLACLNGAVSTDVIREFTYGGDGGGNLWSWFRKGIKDSYGAVGAIVARWQAMMREPIAPGNRAFVIAALIKQAGLKGKEKEAVEAQALEAPPTNHYEAMNLLTWAASHAIEEPRAIVRAMTAASDFSSEERHHGLCPVCRRTR